MPVRIPDYPVKPAAPEQTVAISARSVMAPALALAESVAPALGEISHTLRAYADEVQAAENWQTLTERKAMMRRAYADFQNDVAGDAAIDPADHLNLWRARAKEIETAVLDNKLPPVVRETLTREWTDWRSRTELKVARDATLIRIDRVKRTFDNEYTENLRTQRFAENDQLIEGASAILDPPQQEKLRQHNAEARQDREMLDYIRDHPFQYREENPRPRPDQPDEEWQRYDSFARQLANQQTADLASDILAGVWSDSSEYRTLEQVDEKTKGLPEPVRREIHNSAAWQFDQKLRAIRSSPQFIDKTVGQASAIIEDLDPAGNGVKFQVATVRARGLLAALPEDLPSRAALEARLSDLVAGKRTHARNAAERATSELNRVFKNNLLGPLKKSMTLGQALDDGLLDDPAKLTAYGLDQKDAAKVAELAKTQRPQAMEAFRSGAANARKAGAKNTLDPFTTAALNAVRDRKTETSQVEWTDPAAMRTAERTYGRALIALDEWARQNPRDAMDGERVGAFMQTILSPEAAAQVAAPLLDPPPEPPQDDWEGIDEMPPWDADPARSDLLPPLTD